MSKRKDVNISADSANKKKKSRLDGMLESMNSRSDPMSTHKIATKYFQSFKAQRNIKDVGMPTTTTAVVSAVPNTVDTADSVRDMSSTLHIQRGKDGEFDLLHTKSEEKVYNAIKYELRNIGEDKVRIGVTKFKRITGLSDKTIRVVIHNLLNKKSIEIIGPSMGIYGRIFCIPPIEEVVERRIKEGIKIDKNTKSIIPR